MSAFDETVDTSWEPLVPENFENNLDSAQSSCRYAKDENYLNAVLNVWKKDSSATDTPVEISRLTYQDADGNPLYGRVVRLAKKDTSNSANPGVLLFHTAAGPHDVFLFYKPSLLAREG
ncbi:MAG: hypothetical protein SGILL_001369, partial [Bacillariaceae sp.]